MSNNVQNTEVSCHVELRDVSKRYNIYDKPTDRLKEILLRNKRCFHKEYWALRDFSYTFERHTTAILGANGSGKSTLLQLMAGVVQPTTGQIATRGRLTAILELGAGFQTEYTGRENALLYGMILGISEEEMKDRLEEINEYAELGDFFDQPIKTYSSGMVVRLAFACATSVDCDILLIDEALSVGDEHFKWKCLKRIAKLQEDNKTIIFVSHNMQTVRDFCHSAILLNAGKIVDSGAVDDIIPQYCEIVKSKESQSHKRFTSQPSIL
ncbi:MAG: ABC transporter ATP-binding protein [Cyanobacteria bacterium TGS_CYA1]|nr:ABC transporter ATP-binding protein [Cyanobacteria bacterium TGS_CYA1]